MPTKIIKIGRSEPIPFGQLDHLIDIAFTSQAYSFDIGGVFRDPATGQYWWGTDSGCSCPQPWDGIRSTSDLSGPHDWNSLVAVILSQNGELIGGETYRMRAMRLLNNLATQNVSSELAA